MSNHVSDEVIHRSERSLIIRRRFPDRQASIVFKQPLGPHAPARLRHERAMLTRLAGVEGVPALVPEHDIGDAIAMTDIQGLPLPQVLSAARADMPALIALALSLARVLAAVHKAGVLHKDVNPTNVLLAPSRTAVLIDFELATGFAEEQPMFTHHSEILGNLAYLAPERTGRTGRTVDLRADLYALGATLYEMTVGHPPFVAHDPLQLIYDHLTRVPTPPVVLKPGLPQALSDIILRLLEKEPDRRYQSADGLVYDLSQVCALATQRSGAGFVLGKQDFPLRLLPPSRLVGRDDETRALETAFDNALLGRCPGVLVAGTPGVGKTSLINELRPVVTARRGWFVAGKFDQYRRDLSADGVYQAMRALGRLLLAEPEAELAQLRRRLFARLGPAAADVAALMPEFALILGEQQASAEEADSREAGQRLIEAAVNIVRAVASPARPLVMVMDDLQWSAALPLAAVDALMIAGVRGVLLVGAYRDNEVDAAHPLSPMLSRWQRLEPPPLSLALTGLPPGEIGTLLAQMLRLAPGRADELAQVISRHTGGNPYNTVELINALRHDGLLAPGQDGWRWDREAVQRYVGQGSVMDLLARRIGMLPAGAAEVVEIMGCLGGEVEHALLQAATGLSPQALEQQLAPPLEDGLLVLEREGPGAVRFRHDRVQQAAYGYLEPMRRRHLHLSLARRLAALPQFATVAAAQYLPAIDEVDDPQERRRAVALFRGAAAELKRFDLMTAERFLATAIRCLEPVDESAEPGLQMALDVEIHAVLYGLGRFAEADRVYRAIEAGRGDPMAMVDAACVQVSSLTNRGRPQDAVDLGLALLEQLGYAPAAELEAELPTQMADLYRWIAALDRQGDLHRPTTAEPLIQKAAQLFNRLIPPAFFCGQRVMAWLVLEARRLWEAHGPVAALVGPASHLAFVTIGERGDYAAGYKAVRHVLEVSEARGYEPETSQARFLFGLSACHCFEPLESGIEQAERAREGLLRGGDLQNACFTYYASLYGLLDCAPSLDAFQAEVQAALALAERTGNDQASASWVATRQLIRSLRGQTQVPGGFDEASFDEAAHRTAIANNPVACVNFYAVRALAAAVFGNTADLQRCADDMTPLVPVIGATYLSTTIYLLALFALIERVKAAPQAGRETLLGELDAPYRWLSQRALEAPDNFLHLLEFINAERAWALGDPWAAMKAFDAALVAVEMRQRPWQRAFIAERAGLFQRAHGLEHSGRLLLAQARERYAAWGAVAKVRAMGRQYPFLRATGPVRPAASQHSASDAPAAEAIDMVAILRASQALSTETSLDALVARVIELLAVLAGATGLQVLLWRDEAQGWVLAATDEGLCDPVPVAEAGAQGLLPLSAFHYAERTRVPLPVEDALTDDRFAHDPYLAGADQCSLLAVPILSKGEPRAMLVLENRLSRGAFSADRLDAVMLIAGQLAVSLDNALLETNIEQSEQAKAELRRHNAELTELNAKLSLAKAQLLQSEKLASIGQLAAGVAHEINNPMGFIFSNFGTLGDYLDDVFELLTAHEAAAASIIASDEAARLEAVRRRIDLDYLKEDIPALMDETREGIARVRRIVQDLRDFSRTESDDAWQWANLAECIDSTLNIVASELRYKVDVVKDYAELPDIECLPSQLNQVIMNLVVNAAHACAEKRGTLAIRTGRDGDAVWFEAEDNGRGIDERDLPRIFDPFFTTKPVGQGTGLGLSITYGIVQTHHGRIEVDSAPGKGTRFRVILPMRQNQN